MDSTPHAIDMALGTLERWRLVLRGYDGEPPLLLDTGRQFLARHGHVPTETLDFLPGQIDDLNAREALRRASFVLMDEFTHAITDGSAVDYVREQSFRPRSRRPSTRAWRRACTRPLLH